jgi:hypothetical protein
MIFIERKRTGGTCNVIPSRVDGEGPHTCRLRQRKRDYAPPNVDAQCNAEAEERLRGRRSSHGRGPIFVARDDKASLANSSRNPNHATQRNRLKAPSIRQERARRSRRK